MRFAGASGNRSAGYPWFEEALAELSGRQPKSVGELVYMRGRLRQKALKKVLLRSIRKLLARERARESRRRRLWHAIASQ